MRWLRAGMATVALIAGNGSAWAQSDLEVTPDGERILISKDVSGSRWAITYEPEEGTVTGNVFPLDGSPPQFLWCREVGPLGAPAVELECHRAEGCTNWHRLEPLVSISRSFFDPERRSDRAIERRTERRMANASGTAALSRYGPSGWPLLISKEVGDERWTISVERDGSVFGNVFSGDEDPPTFLSCDPADGAAPESVALNCSVLARGVSTPVGNVEIPRDFLRPRCSGTRSPAPSEDRCTGFPRTLAPPRVFDLIADPVPNPLEPFGSQLRIEELPELGSTLVEATTLTVLNTRSEIEVGCAPEVGPVDLAWRIDTGEESFVRLPFDPPAPRCRDYGMPIGTRCEWAGWAPAFDRQPRQFQLRSTEVIGYESITVPAGTFHDAMVLEQVVTRTGPRVILVPGPEGEPPILVRTEGEPLVSVLRSWIDDGGGLVRHRCVRSDVGCDPGLDLAEVVAE